MILVGTRYTHMVQRHQDLDFLHHRPNFVFLPCLYDLTGDLPLVNLIKRKVHRSECARPDALRRQKVGADLPYCRLLGRRRFENGSLVAGFLPEVQARKCYEDQSATRVVKRKYAYSASQGCARYRRLRGWRMPFVSCVR
jgi:hypothetical protein